MVEWLAGNRIRGTSTERTTGAGFNPVDAISGGWKELARTTLGSTGDSINVTSLPDKKYYMFLAHGITATGNMNYKWRVNGDTSSHYAVRYNDGEGAGNDSSQVNYPHSFPAGADDSSSTGTNYFNVGYISSIEGKNKLSISHELNDRNTGAGTLPRRFESVCKYCPTDLDDPISSINLYNDGTGDYSSDSEVVVLGWDTDDTHTDNFWEELVSVNASGSSTTLDTGTFTAKKYLWVQIYLEGASNLTTQLFTYNNDSNTLYCQKGIRNGTASSNVSINHANLNVTGGTNQKGVFFNGFIINSSSKEKLATFTGVGQNTAGSAATNTIPVRLQQVHKYASNTQITRMKMVQDNSVNYGSKSIIKVWGSN